MFSRRSAWVNRFGLLITLTTASLILAGRTGWWPALVPVTTLLYSWTIVLAAFALLLGIANVAWVHWQRVQQGGEEWSFSLLLLIALAAVLVGGLLGPGGTASPLIEWIFDNLIAPGQAALFALTAFFMVAATYRYLRIGRTGALWILLAVLLTLVVQTPWTQARLQPFWAAAADWLLVWPVMAALRGALLGAGLAALMTGLRLIMRDE